MAEKQKILHIVEAMGGGVFTYIVELANGLCDKYDITIAFGVRSETPENYQEYFNENVKLIQVKNFTRSVNPTKDFKAYKELKHIVKNLEPNVVHLHSSKAGAIGRLMLRSKHHKMFYTPHGYSFLMEGVSPIKRWIYKTIEWICGRARCTTVACGRGEWESGICVSKFSTYICNGVNIQKLDKILEKPLYRGNKHKFTVYTVGRINYQKNPEIFNEIAGRLPDIRFIWVGEGDMRDSFTNPNIGVTGWAQSDQALEIANHGDAFILASRWEGLPIALMEAMYMKKPCMVTNIVGNKDIINDGINGYICNTADEFVDAILKIKNNDHSEMVKKAREDIIEHYNSGWLCARYNELYKEYATK